MLNDRAAHWQSVYRSKQADEVSWFTPHPTTPMELLVRAGVNPESRLIDVGAGASTLIDDLLEIGRRYLTLVDVSAAALDVARQRLGPRAEGVHRIVADAADLQLPPLAYDIWHDRAALHFLVDPTEAAAYVTSATRTLTAGGFAIIGGFAADGPERCSQLPVVRREPQEIAQLFGSAFDLVESRQADAPGSLADDSWGNPGLCGLYRGLLSACSADRGL